MHRAGSGERTDARSTERGRLAVLGYHDPGALAGDRVVRPHRAQVGHGRGDRDAAQLAGTAIRDLHARALAGIVKYSSADSLSLNVTDRVSQHDLNHPS